MLHAQTSLSDYRSSELKLGGSRQADQFTVAADLSDFFYVWLKRFLPKAFAELGSATSADGLSPKAEECVWNQAHKADGKAKDAAFFERKIGSTFVESRRLTQEDGIGCVVFAHKTTEGWESLLRGIVDGGWVVVGSWPIATEQAQRLVARDSAALATSVHLVCRPRSQQASTGDWGDVLRELPIRVGDWIERLQKEGVRGADLVFACIGPAMEIYSRYKRVEDAEGRQIPLGGELLPQEEISFDSDVYLLLPQRAQELKAGAQTVEVVEQPPERGTGAGGDLLESAGAIQKL